MSAPTQRDPRSIVTPDAFDVSGALLGVPLASPGRRLAALLVDVVVIGVITVVTRSFALILGVVAAVFFMRAGFRRTPVRGSVFGRAMRASVGCLGLLIAGVTAVVWSSCGPDFRSEVDPAPDGAPAPGTQSIAAQVLAGLAASGLEPTMDEAGSLEEAERVAAQLVRMGRDMGLDDDELRAFLTATVPEDAAWAAEAPALFSRLLGEEPVGLVGGGPRSDVADVTEYSVEEALEAYAAVLSADTTDEGVLRRRRALEARLAGAVAADTLEALEERIAGLEDRSRRQQRDLARAAEEVAEATSGGVFDWLREFVDELGFGFGWASLYMTLLLSWWRGQTVGKRLMGIRVVRLDGQPISWWVAFERAGGYAAGFATGLLGFAQVYWDANRQAIHDRIVGTVVVIDRAEKVMDWESAT